MKINLIKWNFPGIWRQTGTQQKPQLQNRSAHFESQAPHWAFWAEIMKKLKLTRTKLQQVTLQLYFSFAEQIHRMILAQKYFSSLTDLISYFWDYLWRTFFKNFKVWFELSGESILKKNSYLIIAFLLYLFEEALKIKSN